ncbi:MAG: hypothetical protein ACI8WT_002129 [Clostridium sp.]|jgi:hypothetical protein
MGKQKKFQNKKLNKDDHKVVERAASGFKKGLAAVAIMAPVVALVKKNGVKGIKQLSTVALKIIFKL